ncbi:MAG: hypothetical protein U0326_21420 [Polyangiales bacterium]
MAKRQWRMLDAPHPGQLKVVTLASRELHDAQNEQSLVWAEAMRFTSAKRSQAERLQLPKGVTTFSCPG